MNRHFQVPDCAPFPRHLTASDYIIKGACVLFVPGPTTAVLDGRSHKGLPSALAMTRLWPTTGERFLEASVPISGTCALPSNFVPSRRIRIAGPRSLGAEARQRHVSRSLPPPTPRSLARGAQWPGLVPQRPRSPTHRKRWRPMDSLIDEFQSSPGATVIARDSTISRMSASGSVHGASDQPRAALEGRGDQSRDLVSAPGRRPAAPAARVHRQHDGRSGGRPRPWRDRFRPALQGRSPAGGRDGAGLRDESHAQPRQLTNQPRSPGKRRGSPCRKALPPSPQASPGAQA